MMRLKVWVQPVGGLWEVKHNGHVESRARDRKLALEEGRNLALDLMKKNKEGVEIILEEQTGKLIYEQVEYIQ